MFLDRGLIELAGSDRRLRFTDPALRAIKRRYEAGGFSRSDIPPPLQF